MADSEAAAITERAHAALERARAMRMSYRVCVLTSDETPARCVVLLGEAHLKLPKAARVGLEVVGAFELRGVEGFPKGRVWLGRFLMLLVEAPRAALRLLSFGFVRGSTIIVARELEEGVTVPLENPKLIPVGLQVGALYLTVLFVVLYGYAAIVALRAVHDTAALQSAFALALHVLGVVELHFLAIVPAWLMRSWRFAWVIHPLVAILSMRDRLMADGIARMMRAHPEAVASVSVMGRAHIAGVSELLQREYGYRLATEERKT